MEQKEFKTFSDLREEIIHPGLCGKCGGCVSFCSAGRLNALEMGADDLPRYADENKCVACGICYLICPATGDLDGEIQERFAWHAPIGSYQTITSSRSTAAEVLSAATDGGVVTALLLYLLDRHLIDGAIVSRKTSAFGREAVIASSREEILAAAGSHFGGSAHLEELGDRYTTYSPTISAVQSLKGGNLRSVAIVGTPCQVNTIRKMQSLGILPSHIISYVIGLFCMENFAFEASGRKKLEEMLNLDLNEVDKLNVKDDVMITTSDGRTIHVPFAELDDVARPACLACTDFANDYADLSVGGLGSPSGYTTILIRTDKGARAYGEAMRQGYIEERKLADSAALRSEKTKMIAKAVAFAQRKRERGEARRATLAPKH